MPGFFDKSIEFLKGVGPQRADLLKKELQLFTYADLLQYYPFRYEDKTKFYRINELQDGLPSVQVIGTLTKWETVGIGRKSRLVGKFSDETGQIDLVWFKGAKWVQQKLKPGGQYIAFGKPARYGSTVSIAHPDIEVLSEASKKGSYLQPVYPTTEKLKRKFLDSKALSKLTKALLVEAIPNIPESLPKHLIDQYKLLGKKEAIINIHFPKNPKALQMASYRLKFEELFYIQLQLMKLKISRVEKFRGFRFDNSEILNDFYSKHLPFELTKAQKKVIKEVYSDLRSGAQMNRLVQGDVGSGKTMVAFMCMLIAISNGCQCAMMAPTEILSEQHYNGLKEYADKLDVSIARLTGSSKTSERKEIHEQLENGSLKILVGTHALIEEKVKFKQLGLAVIDEQHRFGVAQRAKLWQKNENLYPHVLVMTATPIPRTLAMTLYGDLDISTIDELPAGRKPIKTSHLREGQRLRMFGFIDEEVKKGRQVYIVYPLIEESSKLDYKDLMDGYESVARRFPNYHISILHGKMKPQDKDWEMQRFVKGETQIMVATTVIEVGVNVPNASVMVIENAEKFGLSQLHQLRGRVGRGAEQSFCILMSGDKLTTEARKRLQTMVETNDGFKIAETDLQLRGPGDLMGTQQSGVLDLLISDLSKDNQILSLVRTVAIEVLREDPDLNLDKNTQIKKHINSLPKTVVNWSRIS